MIIQVNTYTCDRCQTMISIPGKVLAHSDPVVPVPTGWDCSGSDGDLCASCVEKLRVPTQVPERKCDRCGTKNDLVRVEGKSSSANGGTIWCSLCKRCLGASHGFRTINDT
jgi:hypothetical protein